MLQSPIVLRQVLSERCARRAFSKRQIRRTCAATFVNEGTE